MNPRVKTVQPENNYILRVNFTNGEVGLFDVKPYLNFGIFVELKDKAMFNSVFADGLGIEWANSASLCPDTVYLDSVKIKPQSN